MTDMVCIVFSCIYILIYICKHIFLIYLVLFQTIPNQYLANCSNYHHHQSRREFSLLGGCDAITSDTFTAIMYGGIHTQSPPSKPRLVLPTNHVFNCLSKTLINDVIVVGKVPPKYLKALSTTFKTVRKLSLYAYRGDFFEDICEICPELRDLTLELMDKRSFDFRSCEFLTNFWIWNADYNRINVS